MTNTEQRIEKASKTMGRAVAKLMATDPEMGKRVAKALAAEMQAVREGR